MKAIAIIPARSGSKGLHDKNIKLLNGKPLIAYTINAAIESNCFENIMVSTDSDKYADISKDNGAEVPFLRTEELSGDSASSWDVVREVLSKYKSMGQIFDYVALLQPTSPLRDYMDIVNAFKVLDNECVTNVVSVVEVEHPVQWCFELPQNGSMENFANSPYSNMRRQELAKNYRENGAIYIVDAKKIMDKEYNLYADACHAYIMSQDKSVDIDTQIDFVIAEALMKEI